MILDRRHLDIVLSDSIDDYPEGIVVPVDKPYRWTSADVIRKLKYCACRHFRKKNLKVGHAGTLDPLATGVLLVCIGKATRQAEEFQRHEKEYVAGVAFGATTPSYDLEKEIDARYPTDGVSEDALRAVLPSFIGMQEQVAPLFSAKSVDGVRAYELARKEWKKMKSGDAAGFDHSVADLLSKQMIEIREMELLRFWPEGVPSKPEETPEEDGSIFLRRIYVSYVQRVPMSVLLPVTSGRHWAPVPISHPCAVPVQADSGLRTPSALTMPSGFLPVSPVQSQVRIPVRRPCVEQGYSYCQHTESQEHIL